MDKQFDVIVVGGGMVGATVGCALGNTSLKVGVIEQSVPATFKLDQPHDLRISALSKASQAIFESLAVWPGIIERRACPYKRMRVWELGDGPEFRSQDINQPELGFIVENRVTQLALFDRLQDFDNVELICPDKITKIDYGPDSTTIELESGRRCQTRLLVAADGGNSKVRQTVGLGVNSWDYEQQAMVLYVATEYEQQDITWQRFVPSGPQAFLPLTGRFGSVVWYNSPDEVQRLKALPKTVLLEELMASFPECLGAVSEVLGVASFPLKRQHALRYVKPGVALVGDAAHMINPLAGQGVNIGLLDAAALAEVLVAAHYNGEEINSLNVLRRYESLRRNENLKMMNVMEVFYRVFSNQVRPLQLLRNIALGFADRFSPARYRVMRYAMGLEGRLPKLAKGQSIIDR
ncbi:MAG: FAD-dependent monooxygenase [Methylococcales bacterium]|jgi:2-octaprenyl-3-methyl-6-methoxy-1,4-benzoquinol hydroxylase|nr:2-octaprenyl-3-methyl-6-methoxy-1,4-benzoquinol hydroxylase [Methylococcaceae bacterium]HIL41597.1 2-octaprenyl-3-methyl-6-methoxy-1,4-benzoquinol hydroxylase [Methylococcales bacterium]